MTFDEWLDGPGRDLGIDVAFVAAKFGVHVATVYRWRSHTTMPRPQHVWKMARFTRGAVKAEDWYKPLVRYPKTN